MQKKITYDELLKMDGKKVWVEDCLKFFPDEYHIVDVKNMKLRTGKENYQCWDIVKEYIDHDFVLLDNSDIDNVGIPYINVFLKEN